MTRETGDFMRAVIANEVPGTADRLRQVVLAVGLECAADDCVAFADLPVRLARTPADLVLVAIGPNPAAALPVIQDAARTPTPVLAVGPSSDSQQILQAIRSGAREYLDEAHLRDELLSGLEKLRRTGTMLYRRGRTFAVLAATPGSGVTTVATSLAFALAEKNSGRVALAEVGDGVPSLALNLNLEPRHSVADIALHWDRLDATMLRQTLVEHPDGVSVLAYKPETLRVEPLQPAAMRQTLVLLGALFDFAVLDLGHAADANSLEALRLANSVVLVVRLDVPSLRLSRQLIRQLLDQSLTPDKLRVVVNRFGQREQVPWKKASEVLGLPIIEWIPDDPATVNHANNHGLPLVSAARRAAITRAFGNLATSLNGSAA
jgi:pilus assembly protein CpaE